MNADSYYKIVKGDLAGFGENAVADVGRIMTLVQSMKVPEREIMNIVQYVYITHYQAVKNEDANKARQSWVAASGNNFEDFMRHFINDNLNAEGILAVKGDRLRHTFARKQKFSLIACTLPIQRRQNVLKFGDWISRPQTAQTLCYPTFDGGVRM